MELFYYLVFGGLAAVAVALELSKSNKDRINASPPFNSFTSNYLLVYSLVMVVSGLLLFSAFELWLVAEHFRCALLLTLVGFRSTMALVSFLERNIPWKWPLAIVSENYGDPSENKDGLTQFKGAAVAVHQVSAFPIAVMFGLCSIFLFVASILQRRLLAISDTQPTAEWSMLEEKNGEADASGDA